MTVKIGKHIGFCVYHKSYLLWSPVIITVETQAQGHTAGFRPPSHPTTVFAFCFYIARRLRPLSLPSLTRSFHRYDTRTHPWRPEKRCGCSATYLPHSHRWYVLGTFDAFRSDPLAEKKPLMMMNPYTAVNHPRYTSCTRYVSG